MLHIDRADGLYATTPTTRAGYSTSKNGMFLNKYQLIGTGTNLSVESG